MLEKQWSYDDLDVIVYLEAQIAFLMFVIVAYCNIIRAYQRGTNERQLFRQKMIKKKKTITGKFLVSGIAFLGFTSPPVSFFITVFVNLQPLSWARYFLNGPLQAHLEPCQKSKMRFFVKTVSGFEPLEKLK